MIDRTEEDLDAATKCIERQDATIADLVKALEAIAANCGANSSIGRIARAALEKARQP